ncbi:ABC transporter permease [Oscillochloris sp. ZM17-4]|uniref:ABC transporter permease n=1 Tax=Oscillochloris sp. ZM17-4 TaxID=2866714 RepID=UPI001C72FF07|nr:ABC transporter permease [Oscillochloris sp. ZM17-4]MBX0331435.1 ABC transporter permease [Oscillochloris sp. ZM17-4]
MSSIQHSTFKIQHFLPPILTFALAMAAWESLVRGFDIPLYLLPAPSQVVATFMERPVYLLGIGLATFGNALVGSLIGCGLGCLVAAACVRWPLAADGLVPLSVAASAVPIIALSPLLGIWLGSISPASKVGVVAIMTFFPTLVNVYRGLSSPRADSLLLMRSYAARQRDIFLKLRVPAALPFLFNALRICASLSMIGAVVAEFFGGPQNALGVYIKTQAGILRTAEAWSAIVVACLFGLLFYMAVVAIERRALRWKL